MKRARGLRFSYPHRHLGYALLVLGVTVFSLGFLFPNSMSWFFLGFLSLEISGLILAFVLRTIERRPASAFYKEDLEEETEPAIECIRCGFRNAPGLRFCGMCGASLSEQTQIY